MSNTRRITAPQPVEFYELRFWDGGNGTTNPPSGFIVDKLELAEQWSTSGPGRDYRTTRGVLIHHLEDMPEAEEVLKRQKAMNKLTVAEQKLLGLI